MIFLNYKTLLKQLYAVSLQSSLTLGLQNIEALCRALGNPQDRYRSIHIAGTNGKGSVVTKIADGLTLAGWRVGLYTSPHIASFRERIRVNGALISEKAICSHLRKIFALAEQEKITPSFFEYVTALAFSHFAEEKVDIVVLETGLGGRLDATNICQSMLSVITSISLDHTAILGETLEQITREKAGIIKQGSHVIIGPQVQVAVVQPVAQSLNASLAQVQGTFHNFEEENRAIAKNALEYLQVDADIIEKGICALPPCRFERVPNAQLEKKFGASIPIPAVCLLDVAHNPDGIKKLFSRLQQAYAKLPIHVVYGASRDKDIKGCLEIILKKAQVVTFIAADTERAAKQEELMAMADYSLKICSHTIEEAFYEAARAEAIFVVCGTFFIMKKARQFLGYYDEEDALDLNEKMIKMR